MKVIVQYVEKNTLEGAQLDYGFVRIKFGDALLVMKANNLVGLFFVDEGRPTSLKDMRLRFSGAFFKENKKKIASILEKIKSKKKIPMTLIGTPFQHKVWKELLKVPEGKKISYGDLAKKIGKPLASRAVGGALNKNKIAWLVPCHRIVASNGALNGYRYGLKIKQKILENEATL